MLFRSNMTKGIAAVTIERGFDVREFSLLSFGGAGGLHAVTLRYVDPQNFWLLQLVIQLCMVALGGVSSLLGSVLGASLITLLLEALRAFKGLWEFAVGAIIALALSKGTVVLSKATTSALSVVGFIAIGIGAVFITSDMVFPVYDLVAYLSQCMSLDVGDVIATGTPAGVGLGRKPPVYLCDNDELHLGITGLGEQRYRMVADRS